MGSLSRILPTIAGAAALASCATLDAPAASPAADFFDRIAGHCGKAYAGQVVSEDPADEDFASQPLVMHVADCSDSVIRIPFHVGADRSRTWVLTRRNGDRIELKHDHRHEDGSSDAGTMYGGTSMTDGTARRQEFPVDRYSIDLFERQGLDASVTNVWAMEITDDMFAYELRRPSGRFFRAQFDLTTPVAQPPHPWGD